MTTRRSPRNQERLHADLGLQGLRAEVHAEKARWRTEGESGPLRLSRAAYRSIHRDFRSDPGDPPACLVDTSRGTCSVPVEILP